jgi:uncharacterized repeat protein (TIGR01451 family)
VARRSAGLDGDETVSRLVLALALVASLALGALPAGAGLADVNGKIAFERHHEARGGQQSFTEIWTMDQDGSAQRRLAAGEDPDWSPDGTQIAFAHRGSLFVMGADGSGERRLPISPGGSNPDWSPDGTQLVFGLGNTIYVVAAAGGTARQLFQGGSGDYTEVAPAWSPDGSKIAFLASGAVWVINADGSGLRALPGTRVASASGMERGTAWSPDGSTIAYGDTAGGLSTVRIDGAEPVQLVPYLGGEHADNPTWSPDGRRVAFVHNNRDICAVGADGSGLGRLTHAPDDVVRDESLHFNRGPDWQPLPHGSAPAGPPAARTGPDRSWNRSHAWGFACTRQLAGRSLTGSATPARVRTGKVVTYRIRAQNRGPAPIGEMLDFSASLDGGLRLLSASSTQGRCGWSGHWDRGSPEYRVECSLGALFPGERATVTLRARAKTPGELVLTANFVQPAVDEDPDEVIIVPPPTGPAAPDLLKRTRVLGCTKLGTQRPELLVGTARADVLCGLDGEDRLRPGRGRDLVSAGRGDDRVDSRDGWSDVVICGSGLDSVVADSVDRVGRHCETIVRR